jgi:hypothetical protein
MCMMLNSFQFLGTVIVHAMVIVNSNPKNITGGSPENSGTAGRLWFWRFACFCFHLLKK